MTRTTPFAFFAVLFSVAACGSEVAATTDAGLDGSSSTDASDLDSAVVEDAPLDVDASSVDAGSGHGFGEPCTLDGVSPCDDGLLCISPAGNDGFCSKNCEVSGRICPSAPEGTTAYCIVGEEGTPNGMKACAFLCAGGGGEFACPGTLTCASTEEPPGSGQRLCLP